MTKQNFIDSAVISFFANPAIKDVPVNEIWALAESVWEARPRNKAVKKERQAIARFVKPTPSEVDAYIKEKGYTMFDGQKFCDFYEAKGWTIGKTPMKDWKAAIRNWGSKEKERKAKANEPVRRRL